MHLMAGMGRTLPLSGALRRFYFTRISAGRERAFIPSIFGMGSGRLGD